MLGGCACRAVDLEAGFLVPRSESACHTESDPGVVRRNHRGRVREAAVREEVHEDAQEAEVPEVGTSRRGVVFRMEGRVVAACHIAVSSVDLVARGAQVVMAGLGSRRVAAVAVALE